MTIKLRFGPAGFGAKLQEAAANLERFHKLGIKACEIPFTYGVFIKEDKHKKEIREIKEAAEKFDIGLSIHAPYWLNLNSKEKKKIKESKDRILACCKIGELIGAYKVVFHPGYYGDMDKEETYQNPRKSEEFSVAQKADRKEQAFCAIKKAVLEIREEIKKNKWSINIAAETTGKINVFGSVEEIYRLVEDTGCSFCLDFSHLYARSLGKISYGEIYKKFEQFPSLHCHFSGINFGDKGEKSHKLTPDSEIKKLLDALPKNKDITIINESPDPIGDALKMRHIVEKSR